MADDLLHVLGIDPEDPKVAAAIDDARAAGNLMDALVERRLALGLMPSQMDERLGWVYGEAHDFERMGGNPRVSTVQRYARALGLRLELTFVGPGQDWETNAVTQRLEPHQVAPLADHGLFVGLSGEPTP